MSTQTNGIIHIGNFKIDKNNVLGKGATGLVYKGVNGDNNEPIAVKAIEMSQVNNEVTKYLLQGQKKALTTIKSPYVVKTYDLVQEKDFCYIMMEQCLGGTLKDLISKKGKFKENEAIQIFRKLVIGYTSIVQALFIHRDLKTANIIMRSNGDPVIIDFGYCEMIMGKRPMIQYNVGSPTYMAPESYTKSRYSQKSDIWSLGIIFYEMLTGKTPDNGIKIKQYFKDIESKGFVNLNYQGFSPVCKQLLQLSLAVKPQERGTIHKLKYVIDKSMIPKMQVQLKKNSSDITPSSHQQPTIIRTNVNVDNNQLKNKIDYTNTNKAEVQKNMDLNKWKIRSTCRQSLSINQRQNKIQMNKSTVQASHVPSSPKSLLKIQSPTSTNAINSMSNIFLKKSQTPPPHFQTITRKKLQIGDTKAFSSFQNITDKPSLKGNLRNIPMMYKAISLPPETNDVFGNIRII